MKATKREQSQLLRIGFKMEGEYYGAGTDISNKIQEVLMNTESEEDLLYNAKEAMRNLANASSEAFKKIAKLKTQRVLRKLKKEKR